MLSGRFRLFTWIIAAGLMFFACSPERRLANAYVKNRAPMAVLLLMPDFSYKYSYKLPGDTAFDSLPGSLQDSLLFYNSKLVQYLDDSTLFSSYFNGISAGLESYGFSVFNSASAENFVNSGSEALIFNLAQLQLEEYYDSISDEASFGEEELYNYELYITAVNVNSWFEISKVNVHDSARRILYASQTLTDDFNGGFRYFPFSGEVKYTYTIDSLAVGDIYQYINVIGQLYSGYLYDYLLNEYIRKNLPEGSEATQRYTYNLQSGVIRKSKNEGFSNLNPD